MITNSFSTSQTRTDIAILGAGPTGLGAAWRMCQRQSKLHDAAAAPFLLLDQEAEAGGRAASFTTPEGFVFDLGGHVLFPHAEYTEFAEVLDHAVHDWHASVPIRGVWCNDRIVYTPVQRNIHRLPLKTMVACLFGVWRRKQTLVDRELTLQEYLIEQFGEPLTRHVMGPLNHKQWASSPDMLGSNWSSHRSGSKEKNIPDIKIFRVLRNLFLNRDDPNWSPTTTVRYPKSGGTGAIWRRLYGSLPRNYCRANARVSTIDAGRKLITLTDGTTVQYNTLVSSLPLDFLLRSLIDKPELQETATQLRAAKVQICGFGLRGSIPKSLEGVHAISVPSASIPFWRVNVPSNFSPGTVPDPKTTWSVLCESSLAPESEFKYGPAEIELHLRRMGLISPDTKIISTFVADLEHGYPVPFYGRDRLLNQIQKDLENLDIFSRGRFGGWKYEVSNQDHAFMQGVEVIDRLLEGKPEATYQKTW